MYKRSFTIELRDHVKSTRRPVITQHAVQRDMKTIAKKTLARAEAKVGADGDDCFGKNNYVSNPPLRASLKLGNQKVMGTGLDVGTLDRDKTAKANAAQFRKLEADVTGGLVLERETLCCHSRSHDGVGGSWGALVAGNRNRRAEQDPPECRADDE
eukprot:COSAG01_NODE_4266_length_5196_cov_75.857367_3_plen_156_part_00